MTPFTLEGSRVLVTGGAGLIGRAVVALLIERGAEVSVFDTASSDIPAETRQFIGSVTDVDLVHAAVRSADAVVHLAGIAGLEHGTATDIYRANALGTFTVLEASASSGIARIAYASSINANGLPLNPHSVLPSRYPWNEDEVPVIADAYSLSKQANEAAAEAVRQRFAAQVVGLRYPLVRDITADGGSVFGAHIRRVVRADPRRAACEGWSYLDVTDAARVTLAALEREVPAARGILVASPHTFLSTTTDTALALCAPSVERGEIDGRDVPLDLSRSRDLLGFRPQVLLEDVAPHQLVDLEMELLRD